jgi:recombinational DNA repair protein RecR
MSELNHCRFCNCKTVTDTCKTCEQAVDAERERIIKLLEAEADIMHGFAYAIALIKGEE